MHRKTGPHGSPHGSVLIQFLGVVVGLKDGRSRIVFVLFYGNRPREVIQIRKPGNLIIETVVVGFLGRLFQKRTKVGSGMDGKASEFPGTLLGGAFSVVSVLGVVVLYHWISCS